MDIGDIIEFDVKKNFAYIRPLGSGGTGDTHLFRDDITNMLFAIKKYVPKDKDFVDDHFRRFVDEIKILFRLSHPNIVRVYNYYLYPNSKTGYLQMEYVDGTPIDEFVPSVWNKTWNEVFTAAISAFEYLEKNGILHRDVRPANILIDMEGNVKVIDFGFGKQLDSAKQEKNSILLNWPVTELPNEVRLDHDYDHKTEMYFVGVLFRQLIDRRHEDFRFEHVLDKMTKHDPTERYSSFGEVSRALSEGVLSAIEFSLAEKEVYRTFADSLVGHLSHYKDKFSPITNIDETIKKLESLIRSNALEEYIQDNSRLISCFVSGSYTYNSRKDIEFRTVLGFFNLLRALPQARQKIVFDNIYARLALIEIVEDLPF